MPILAEEPKKLVAAPASEEKIKTMLISHIPKVKIFSIRQSELPGFYQVETNGGVIYVDSDATHFIAGDLYSLDKTSFTNVTEKYRNEMRKKEMATVKPDDMIIFSPKGKPKASITVFTDVDCGYCRKLHSEISRINDLGIEVRYMAFPRAGIGSDSYNKMVSVWCASDKQDALTKSKQGQTITTKTCDNPVAKEFNMGVKFGISGTPALVFNDGHLLQSYVPPEGLAQMLGIVVTPAKATVTQ
jgi:thiol:disulfide interchange protein DsbC